jgi:hypothetical protein
MSTAEAIRAYAALSAAQQVRLLAQFGHNLTIAARDTYDFQSQRVLAPERLRAINEVQHRVFGHITALLGNQSERYPDSSIVSIMLEHTDRQLRAEAERAFQDALRRVDAIH